MSGMHLQKRKELNSETFLNQKRPLSVRKHGDENPCFLL